VPGGSGRRQSARAGRRAISDNGRVEESEKGGPLRSQEMGMRGEGEEGEFGCVVRSEVVQFAVAACKKQRRRTEQERVLARPASLSAFRLAVALHSLIHLHILMNGHYHCC
jgi:hypothetical protein